MRLKLAVSLHITKFDGATITEYDRGMTNAIVQKLDDRLIVTQRPSIDVFEAAADHVSDARGRGAFYWDFNSGLYFVNNDTVYKNSHANPIGTISAGVGRVYFTELAGKLLLADPENDEGWVIDAADNVTQITDTDFPPEATPAVGLADGTATLNGTGYVLGEDGGIYGSDFEDLTSWSALNYLTAEREPDGGTFIGRHHDNIVVMGPRTIEFFQDTANPAGSPLSRREDVFYSQGCHDGMTVWAEGDRLFYVGVDPSGPLGVYALEAFTPRKVSNESIDAFLTNALLRAGFSAVGAGFTARGHTFYKLTLYTTPADIAPAVTLVYDATTGVWSDETTPASQVGQFPLMSWTVRTGVGGHVGEGILVNGDLLTVRDDMTPIDSSGGLVYVEGDYVEDPEYVVGSDASSAPIPVAMRLGMWDGGSSVYKFSDELRLVGDRTETAQAVTITWANERTADFTAARTLDLSRDQKLTRLGRFRRRNYQITASCNEQFRLEALETDIRPGLH